MSKNAVVAALAVLACAQVSAQEIEPAVAPAPAVDPQAGPGSARAGWNIGSVSLYAGGFVEAAGVYRTRNQNQDVLTGFSDVPFADSPDHDQHETAFSARQSRLDLLARLWKTDEGELQAYAEVDLLGSDRRAYVPHDRVGYLLWTGDQPDFYFLAGQDWSLATPYRDGLEPRQENVPLTIDAGYSAGFAAPRQPQLRVVGRFGPLLSLGLSLEQPHNQVRGIDNPDGSAAASVHSVAPDMIVKVASDPGFGHYELYALTRLFHDKAPEFVGVPDSTRSNTTVATSLGVNAMLPLFERRLELQASGLFGAANGRYGAGHLADTVFNTTDGSLYAVREQQAMVGVVAHVTKKIDAYAYGGIEHSKAAYSLMPANNLGCGFDTSIAPLPPGFDCGSVGTVRSATAGAWWEFYRGEHGFLMAGPQFEILNNHTYAGSDGTAGHANESVVMLSLRYYPYQ